MASQSSISTQYQPPKTESPILHERVYANAAIIWPGQGRIFEMGLQTNDYEWWSYDLLRMCGNVFKGESDEIRTTSGPYRSEEQAAEAT
jgi:hypothetical protein